MMTLPQIRLQLAIRTAYEAMFCGGQTNAMKVALELFPNNASPVLTPAQLMMGMLVKHVNFTPRVEDDVKRFYGAAMVLRYAGWPEGHPVTEEELDGVVKAAWAVGKLSAQPYTPPIGLKGTYVTPDGTVKDIRDLDVWGLVIEANSMPLIDDRMFFDSTFTKH
jgi:hypothetical protein